MFTEDDFLTKSALREYLKAGKVVRVIADGDRVNGIYHVEGPHKSYPHRSRWHATVSIENNVVKGIIS